MRHSSHSERFIAIWLGLPGACILVLILLVFAVMYGLIGLGALLHLLGIGQ